MFQLYTLLRTVVFWALASQTAFPEARTPNSRLVHCTPAPIHQILKKKKTNISSLVDHHVQVPQTFNHKNNDLATLTPNSIQRILNSNLYPKLPRWDQ